MRKDPQRKAVYNWQWMWGDWNRQTLSWRRTKRLIQAACKIFDTPFPKIHKIKGKYSYHKAGHIGLIRSHRNTGVALHEAAHYIVHVNHGRQKDGAHGKLFVKVWLILLTHFDAAPYSAISASLKKHGIKYNARIRRIKKKGR